ncbi:hypothetical protein HX878_31665 [Pseudomonas veronii]|uniref:hypothetical protein n=1 Tax=Pseudomonas veronii TaxID=76761 RepID=UPI0015A4ABFF|nr:hypothetical protein [Pseudomonas veronii]NWD59269.1 hypothetical protein [Pseudomonas veronii]
MGAVQADELPSLSIAQSPADKRAQRAENFKTTLSQDGTSTVAALLTYKDGQQENCTLAMVAEPVEKGGAQGLNVSPKAANAPRPRKPTDQGEPKHL